MTNEGMKESNPNFKCRKTEPYNALRMRITDLQSLGWVEENENHRMSFLGLRTAKAKEGFPKNCANDSKQFNLQSKRWASRCNPKGIVSSSPRLRGCEPTGASGSGR